jgi:hypothetical protein
VALEKTNIFVPLGVGLQQGVDERQLGIGQGVALLENAFQLKSGEVVRRYGSTSLSRTIAGSGGTIPHTAQLATHKGALVSQSVSGNPALYSYSDTRQQWFAASSAIQANVSTTRIAVDAGSNDDTIPDVRYLSGYFFICFERLVNANPVVVVQVLDATTNHVVYQTIVTGATRPRVGTIPGYAVVVYVDTATGNVKALTFTAASPTSATSSTLGTGADATGSFLDIVAKSTTTLSVCYRNPTGPKTEGVDYTPSTFTATAYDILDHSSAQIDADLGMAWMQDNAGSGKLALITANTGVGVVVQWDLGTGTAAASYSMDAASAGKILWNVTGVTTGTDATGEFAVWYEVLDFTAYNEMIVPTARVLHTIFQYPPIRSVGLRSKAFTSNGLTCALVSYESEFQPTYFVYDLVNRAPLAKVALWEGNGRSERQSSLSSVSATPSGFVTSITQRTRLDGTYQDVGIDAITIKFDPILSPPVEVGDSLVFPGGVVAAYDGASYSELGFNIYPEAPTLTESASGSLTLLGTYQYTAVYRYTDNAGRVFRSATSFPSSVTLTGSNQAVSVDVPTLRIFGRATNDYVIEIYRTLAGGTVAQLVGTVANDPTVDTVNYADTTADTDLESHPFIYTTGGILDNDPPPGAIAVAVWKGAIVLVPDDDRQTLWFSSPVAPGSGPMFSETTTWSVADQHGDIVSIQVLDDRLAVFKKDAVYLVVGDPPTPAGANTLSVPQLVTIGDGTTNPQGVLATSSGIVYQATSRIGFGVFGEDGAQPAGIAVLDYTETVTSSVLVAPQSQVRLYTASGRTIVYDLITHIWSTYTGQPAVSATSWRGVPVYATSSGTILVEDPSGATYTEAGASYVMTETTPWLSSSGLGGRERVNRIQGVGKTAGNHTLTIGVRYDFDPTIVQTQSEAITGPLWEWTLKLQRQKCSAFQLVISDGGPATAGFRISGIAVRLAGKEGLKKLPSSKNLT